MSLRLLLDENAESNWFVKLLKEAGHDTVCLKDQLSKGATDEQVFQLAQKQNRVLYTQDRDFQSIAKQKQKHYGIILEFLTGTSKDMTYKQIIAALAKIEKHYHNNLKNQFVIINAYKPR